MADLIQGALLGIHAQTSLHAGAGAALGVVDLPIQRERHTDWPTIAGSAIKGVLRDQYRETVSKRDDLDEELRWDDEFEEGEVMRPDYKPKIKKKASPKNQRPRQKADAVLRLNVLFGPPTDGASEFAGVVGVTDARLLAFPVRSLRGVFAWATCPAVLERFGRDAALVGLGTVPLPTDLTVEDRQCAAPSGCSCFVSQQGSDRTVLEEFDFQRVDLQVDDLAAWISNHLLPGDTVYASTRERLKTHLLVLSNNDYTHFVRHATEVTARIGLDYNTKTVKKGALFYQEFLPAESLLYSVVLSNPARAHRCNAAQVRDFFGEWVSSVNETRFMQLGGDETTGKGLCSVRLTDSAGQEESEL